MLNLFIFCSEVQSGVFESRHDSGQRGCGVHVHGTQGRGVQAAERLFKYGSHGRPYVAPQKLPGRTLDHPRSVRGTFLNNI